MLCSYRSENIYAMQIHGIVLEILRKTVAHSMIQTLTILEIDKMFLILNYIPTEILNKSNILSCS